MRGSLGPSFRQGLSPHPSYPSSSVPSSKHHMIDLKFLREQTEKLKEVCRQKNVALDIDAILNLDTKRRELSGKLDELNRLRNDAAKSKDIEAGKRLKQEGIALEAELAVVTGELDPLLLKIPNPPSDDTPVGKDDSENVVIRKVGEPKTFSFTRKSILSWGRRLGLLTQSAVPMLRVRVLAI